MPLSYSRQAQSTLFLLLLSLPFSGFAATSAVSHYGSRERIGVETYEPCA